MFIVFIDDETYVLQSIKRSLTKWFKEHNLNAHFASNSKEALEFIKDNYNEIAVIVSDQQMPDISGSKLLDIIRKRFPNIIFIVLSGHTENKDFDDMVKVGISSFITKPWESSKLKEEIIKALHLYRIKKENNELKSRLNNELLLAKDFQKELLKIEKEDNLPFEINISYIPSPVSGISGDYYDLISIDKDRFLIILGDVSGHGIKPAFITIALKTIIQHQFMKGYNYSTPLEFIKWLNSRVYELVHRFNNLYLSFSLVCLNVKEKNIEVINAGQPPIIIKRSKKNIIINSSNMVLGVEMKKEFISQKMHVEIGDEILMLSDGIHPLGIKNGDSEDYLDIIKDVEVFNHRDLLDAIESKFRKEDLDDDKTIITIKI